MAFAVVTLNYWVFMLTDGALRVLVLLHFHRQGFEPLELALLFVLYECAGVVTNALGGWLGARFGLDRALQVGTALQLLALAGLLAAEPWLTVPWVAALQGLSGIGKDLNKTAAKSGVKVLAPGSGAGVLYRWVSFVTGSKNALKGAGHLLGGLLLTGSGFRPGILGLILLLLVMWIASLVLLHTRIGRARSRPVPVAVFSGESAVNALAAARLFLFASRDVWFAVALPLWLGERLGLGATAVGAFLGGWIVIYGTVQAFVPRLTGNESPGGAMALGAAGALAVLLLALTAVAAHPGLAPWLVPGLLLYAVAFAVNSATHSYLILALAREDGASLDVGFYYAANAAGRLVGTLASGLLYQYLDLAACLAGAVVLVLACLVASVPLRRLAPPSLPRDP